MLELVGASGTGFLLDLLLVLTSGPRLRPSPPPSGPRPLLKRSRICWRKASTCSGVRFCGIPPIVGAPMLVDGAAAAEREGKELMNSRIARVMQALRIEVNGEFAALDSLLGSLPRALAPGGRAVFLTFHSGEDRRVKAAMRDGMRTGVYSEVSRRVVRPGPEEARANPRSRCCKLRWCVRSSAPASSAA